MATEKRILPFGGKPRPTRRHFIFCKALPTPSAASFLDKPATTHRSQAIGTVTARPISRFIAMLLLGSKAISTIAARRTMQAEAFLFSRGVPAETSPFAAILMATASRTWVYFDHQTRRGTFAAVWTVRLFING